MKGKAQIVQELLDKKQITAEEAVTLLLNNEKEYVYVPVYPVPAAPYIPAAPWQSPFIVTCGGERNYSVNSQENNNLRIVN